MKKYLLFLVPLIFVGCDEDLPNQFTSIEGYVKDYYTQEPIPNISLVVTDHGSIDFLDVYSLDTLVTDINGYYYFEFYNDSDRFYMIENITTAIYAPGSSIHIIEGKESKIDIPVKAYIKMNLKFVNHSNLYNKIRVINQEYKYKLEDIYCYDGKDCEMILHIVPEKNTYIQLGLIHINEGNQIDKTFNTTMEFLSGKNDTTITYYY